MRVIGGEAKGRRLVAPKLPTLRPTSDRVRESIFDILESRGLVEDASVLDLYAGSGALGIEALSRGASSCTFVDSDAKAVSAIEQNLTSLGWSSRPGVRVVRGDVPTFLATHMVEVGLALLDPPYRFAEWAQLLDSLRAEVAVLEHASQLESVVPFQTIRSYRYGGTLVTLVARHPNDKDLA